MNGASSSYGRLESEWRFAPFGFGICIAPMFAVLLPLLVGSLSRGLQLSPSEVGMVASVDLVAMMIAQLASPTLLQRWDARRLAATGFAVAAIANIASTGAAELSALTAIRAGAGFGAGLAAGSCFAAISGSRRPERIIALVSALQTLVAAFFLSAAGSQVGEAAGWKGVFYLLAAVAGFGAAVILFAKAPVASIADDTIIRPTKQALALWWSILSASFAFSAAWAFMEGIGAAAGFTPAATARALALGILPSVATPLLVAALAAYVAVRLGLLVSTLGMIAGLALLLPAAEAVFVPAIMVAMAAWAAYPAYALGLAAKQEGGRNVVVIAAALMLAGFAAGPWLGGMIFERVGWQALLGICIGLASSGLIAALASVGLKRPPAGARGQ